MFNRNLRSFSLSPLALTFALAACGGDGPTQSPGQPGMAVIAGAGAADSVGVPIATAVVVEVRDPAGKKVPGAQVQFRAGSVPQRGVAVPVASLAPAGGTEYQPAITLTTDGGGRASALLRLGTVAGDWAIEITAPALGYAVAAPFTVRPGKMARLDVQPRDTAVYQDASYTLRFTAEDRFGNAVATPPATVTMSPTPAPFPDPVAIAGVTVTGREFGRAELFVTIGGSVLTTKVSVVPRGTLLAGGPGGIYMLGLDGSGLRRVVSEVDANSPRWFPDGQSFVFTGGNGHAYVAGLDGATRPLLPNPGNLIRELWAHPSRDGRWIYFGGYTNDSGNPYRVRPDGTGMSLVPGFTPDAVTQAHPTVSPQGDRVVYFREGKLGERVKVRIQSMTTGELLGPDVPGHGPEWGPTGMIAFIEADAGNRWGKLHVMMNPGSGFAFDVGALRDYWLGIDWSPDGRWIVAKSTETSLLEVVDVPTGRAIPLPFTMNLYGPAWH